MGATLLVADEHVAQLRVVAEDVVERQDHAARVAEEDVDALAEERLADDVRADAGPLERLRLVEHLARARSTACGVLRPGGRDVARRVGGGSATGALDAAGEVALAASGRAGLTPPGSPFVIVIVVPPFAWSVPWSWSRSRQT